MRVFNLKHKLSERHIVVLLSIVIFVEILFFLALGFFFERSLSAGFSFFLEVLQGFIKFSSKEFRLRYYLYSVFLSLVTGVVIFGLFLVVWFDSLSKF